MTIAAGAFVFAGIGNEGDPGTTFCKAYGALFDDADVQQVGGFWLLTKQETSRRDPCGEDDLWHYDLPAKVEGVLFDDCLISWTGGGRTDARQLAIPCTA